MIENELSFLVARLPDLTGTQKKEIIQHYLSEGSNLRIRDTDGKYELTKKIRSDDNDDTRKEELNIPLTESEYQTLLAVAHRGLSKTRHYVPLLGGLTAEIDVFHGSLEGLIMTETEFPDDAARFAFIPPDWFGRDVSQEEWSGNSWLADRTIEDVRPHLG